MEVTEKEIMKRLINYTTGTDYEPLQVDLEICSPIYLTTPYINLDSIVLSLCTREALDDLFYILPSDKFIDTSVVDLPFKLTDDVPHCSVGQFIGLNRLKKDTVYKRFTDKETYHLTRKQQKGRIHTDRGHYKDFMIDLPMIICRGLRFYCNADKKDLTHLLSHLRGIGKKVSIGSGRIKSVTIKPISEDYSFYKNGEIMRPIPTKLKVPICEGMTYRMEAYKPPYWNKDNVAMCVVPKSQIKT